MGPVLYNVDLVLDTEWGGVKTEKQLLISDAFNEAFYFCPQNQIPQLQKTTPPT